MYATEQDNPLVYDRIGKEKVWLPNW